MQLVFPQCATLIYTKAYKLSAAASISPQQALPFFIPTDVWSRRLIRDHKAGVVKCAVSAATASEEAIFL